MNFSNTFFCFFVPSAGSSSFESQKMERPSLNVLSPSSPGMLQDAPQLMPGQLSVSVCACCECSELLICHDEECVSDVFVYVSGEAVV